MQKGINRALNDCIWRKITTHDIKANSHVFFFNL
jgi:hypothetical protein